MSELLAGARPRSAKMSDFSIDYILHRAGGKYVGTNNSMGLIERIQLHGYHPYAAASNEAFVDVAHLSQHLDQLPMFDWLQYTRYHPPKLPRTVRQTPAKRTPGRLPRIPFTPTQLETLESAYKQSNYLSAEEANRLAELLELTNTRVKIWFQNRRARERREKRMKEENYESTLSSNTSSPDPHPVPIT